MIGLRLEGAYWLQCCLLLLNLSTLFLDSSLLPLFYLFKSLVKRQMFVFDGHPFRFRIYEWFVLSLLKLLFSMFHLKPFKLMLLRVSIFEEPIHSLVKLHLRQVRKSRFCVLGHLKRVYTLWASELITEQHTLVLHHSEIITIGHPLWIVNLWLLVWRPNDFSFAINFRVIEELGSISCGLVSINCPHEVVLASTRYTRHTESIVFVSHIFLLLASCTFVTAQLPILPVWLGTRR